jgi:hypothetical protein
MLRYLGFVLAKMKFLRTSRWLLLLAVTAQIGQAAAQMPTPALPKASVNTTYTAPVGGKTWQPHNSADLRTVLTESQPGDMIILDANTTYEGSFTLPAKVNPDHKWIYLVSSQLSRLPAPGARVNPLTDAVNMPKIVTDSVTPAITIPAGASYYRLVGLEVASASTKGCNPNNVPPVNCWAYQLVNINAVKGQPLPDSITVDRCYLHGSRTQDVRQAIVANGSNVAVVDSYISDIHQNVFDSQAILAYLTPGPLKIVDNFLSATTEDVMFGGAGGKDNPWNPSDIEIRGNHFFKPLEWAQVGVTIPPKNQWVTKNNLEFKNARRVLVDGNILENSWKSGQLGVSVALTVRTADSGDIAVVDDITLTNNIIKNVAAGFSTLSNDYACGTPHYPNCTNKGEAKRIKIYNNLILFRDPSLPGGARNVGVQMAGKMTDFVFQHNTLVPAPGTDCWNSIYFEVPKGTSWPPPESITHNVWVLDNVLCRPPTGDLGAQGTTGLGFYMGDPPPLATRYLGNEMFVPSGSKTAAFPSSNVLTKTPIKYEDLTQGKLQVTAPEGVKTTDGKPAGVDTSKLNPAAAGSVGNQPSGALDEPHINAPKAKQ